MAQSTTGMLAHRAFLEMNFLLMQDAYSINVGFLQVPWVSCDNLSSTEQLCGSARPKPAAKQVRGQLWGAHREQLQERDEEQINKRSSRMQT